MRARSVVSLLVLAACGGGAADTTPDAAPNTSTIDGAVADAGASADASADAGAVADAASNADAAVTVDAGNGAPSTGTPTLPAVADVTTTLTCTPGADTDPEGSAVTHAFAWIVNDDPVDGATSDTLATPAFVKGDTVRCVVTPNDGTVDGTAATSAPLTIGDAPPTITSVSISPATAHTDTDLTASATGVDPDGDPVTFLVDWTIGGTSTGATGTTLSNTLTTRGDVVRAVITPTDGTTIGAAVTTDPVTILNTAPSAPTIDLQPNFPKSNQDVTAIVTGAPTDLDGDTISFRYFWFINGVALPESDSPILSRNNYHKGTTVQVRVVPTDGTDDGPVSNDDSVLVLNTAPTFTGVAISPATPTPASTLTCVTSGYSDFDGDAAQFKFAWERNGANFPFSTSATVSSAFLQPGDVFRCIATADDGDTLQDGNTLTSSPVTIQ